MICKLLLYVVAFLPAVGCAASHDSVLESKDVQFFKIEQVQARPVKLRISGLAFKSAMSVTKITPRTDDSVIVLEARVALSKPGTSGSFEYELTVPDSVEAVRFGTSPVPIWKRR